MTEGSYHKVTSFSFNSVNQLTQVSLPDGTASSYKYDAAGRRVEKSTGSTSSPVVTRFVYDGQNILAELDGNNNLLALFTQGPGIDQPLIMRKSDGTEYFIHGDALASVVAHTDANGALIERVEYEAYGKPTFVDVRGPPVTSTASLTGSPFAFTGRMWEAETNLYDYRHRQTYDPQAGRFGQEDPIGFAGNDVNLYSYLRNRPLLFRDPLGLAPGDPYPTLDDAIIAAIEQYLGYSIRLNLELGGAIYMQNGLYYYAPAIFGTEDKMNLGDFWVPDSGELIAAYHTHGAVDPNYNSDDFGIGDRNAAWGQGIILGVGTPDGSILKLTPSSKWNPFAPPFSVKRDILKPGKKGNGTEGKAEKGDKGTKCH
ncbi:MAG: DUF4329 domain-containing protein [Elusimicrobia bacterium]|nr:DUF4329 domain-containing protein [Elusimicrobiota bacterium]